CGCDAGPRSVPAPGLRRPAVRLVLPPGDADRADLVPAHRLATGAAQGPVPGRTDRGPARHSVGVQLDAEPARAAGLVRAGDGVRRGDGEWRTADGSRIFGRPPSAVRR